MLFISIFSINDTIGFGSWTRSTSTIGRPSRRPSTAVSTAVATDVGTAVDETAVGTAVDDTAVGTTIAMLDGRRDGRWDGCCDGLRLRFTITIDLLCGTMIRAASQYVR